MYDPEEESMTDVTKVRNPYVGQGEDGCRRSARIDQEEAELLTWSDPRRSELEASAARWDDQAHALMLERLGPRPTLPQVRDSVQNEEWLAALALVELSPGLTAEIAAWCSWSRDSGRWTYDDPNDPDASTFHPHAVVDWQAWAADVDEHGRGWSGTERRTAQLVMALTVGRPTPLVGVLDSLGSSQDEALDIIAAWVTGGEQKSRPGATHGDPSGRVMSGDRSHEANPLQDGATDLERVLAQAEREAEREEERAAADAAWRRQCEERADAECIARVAPVLAVRLAAVLDCQPSDLRALTWQLEPRTHTYAPKGENLRVVPAGVLDSAALGLRAELTDGVAILAGIPPASRRDGSSAGVQDITNVRLMVQVARHTTMPLTEAAVLGRVLLEARRRTGEADEK